MAIITTFLKDLLISFLVWGLSIAPNSPVFLAQYQQLTYRGNDAVIEDVVTAIKEKDEDALFDMFCEKHKNQPEELRKQIKAFLNVINDEIVENEFMGHMPEGKANFGAVSIEDEWFQRRLITASGEKYVLGIRWRKIDVTKPDEVGLICVSLCDNNFGNPDVWRLAEQVYLPVENSPTD